MGGRSKKFIVGIDEVGRGPLAGPVVVAAVLLGAGSPLARRKIRDSKKLMPAARIEWAGRIAADAQIRFALASIRPKSIDRMNVSRAANSAALKAFARLAASMDLDLDDCSVYLDGGLYLGNGRRRQPAKTVVKGDEKIPAVALASIVAKVHRDAIMVRQAKKFPGYGFEVHKGYGTRRHLQALGRLGPSPAHRLSFLGKSHTMKPKYSHGRRTNKTSYAR